MDREPADVVADPLDLARVQAGPDLETERPDAVHDRERTPNGASRPLERGEEAVTRGGDLAPAVASELLAHDRVVGLEEVAPGLVAEGRRPLGRLDDVGEEDRREDSVARGLVARAG